MENFDQKLLTGHLNLALQLPALPRNQIKVFLCCNSTDFCEERDAILKTVIPKLREETKARYGYEYHYMDLKFGVDHPEQSDYNTREFMVNELLRCQRLSVGPNFVVLMGQKYGCRLPPRLILSDIFEMIHQALFNSKSRRARSAALLNKWYKKDENSIPSVHVLQTPLEHSQEQIKKEWRLENAQLRQVLSFGVELCCREGYISPEALRTYFASDFENEIKLGVMSGQEGRILAFNREISDLRNYLTEHNITDFTEVEWNGYDEKWQMENESYELRQSLKEEVIYSNVIRENLKEYSVLWRYDSGIHPVLHKEYLENVCQDFYDRMSHLIKESAAMDSITRLERPILQSEVLVHLRKAFARGSGFQGRENEMNSLMNYVSDPSNMDLFIVYGDSGSGKTSLLSKLYMELEKVSEDKAIIIVRYLGLTQDSSNLRDLLHSLCSQLLTTLRRSINIPSEFLELQKLFKSLLNDFPQEKQLILILDSLTNLLPDFNAHLLYWLPPKLQANVRIITSCNTHAYGILTRLKTEIILNTDNFIELSPLSLENGLGLLLHWLNNDGLCITNQQAEVVKDKLRSCSLPLYIKLLYNDIKKWRSFDIIDPKALGSNCESYLSIAFSRLEQRHGESVVKYSLSYLTSSKTGLSDTEMEDLLSLEENVLAHVFADMIPVVRRCPPIIWARLRNDLDPLLQMSVRDDHDVYFWFHSRITKFVQERYLSDEQYCMQIHHKIADYYIGTWHGVSMGYLDIFGKKASENRHVISQPLTYISASGEIKYNKRKYDQVPRHLYLARRFQELNDKVLFNYDWLFNKIKVLSLQHILADLSLNPSTEASLLEGALRAAQPTLDKDMNSMPVELSGRLLSYYQTHSNIRKLIHQCDTSGLAECPIIPLFSYQKIPGSRLLYTLCSNYAIESMCLVGEGRYVLTKSSNSQLVTQFDLLTGDTNASIMASYGHLHSNQNYLVIVDNEIEKSIKVHKISDGTFRHQLIPFHFINGNDKRKYQLGPISLSSNYIAVLISTDIMHLCVASLEDTDCVEVVTLEARSNLVKISNNDRYVLCNQGTSIVSYSLSTLQRLSVTSLDYVPMCLAMTNDSRKVYYSDGKSPVLTVCSLSSEGATQMVSKIAMSSHFLGDKIKKLKLSSNQTMLAVIGNANIVVYEVDLDKIVLKVKKPEDVMKEFKLPKQSEMTEIVYADATFNVNDTLLITAVFRDIQLWDLSTGLPKHTTIIAPVGVLDSILQSPFLPDRIVTSQKGSNVLHVWNTTDKVQDVTTPDRLPSPVQCICITEDSMLSFVTGKKSDEVAIIDMGTGCLTDLLTHESIVEEITPTRDGSYLFVQVDPAAAVCCNKIWSVQERCIIKDFGHLRGWTVSLKKKNTLIHISQTSTIYQSPYVVTFFDFEQTPFEETNYDFQINNAIGKPFITADDTYMVLLTAESYIEKRAVYENPAICAFYLKGQLMHSVIGKNELSPFLNSRYLVSLAPIATSNTNIIAIFKTYSHSLENAYGFVIIDLATSSATRYSDNFMPLTVNLSSLNWNKDSSQCINASTGYVYDMKSGSCIGNVKNKSSGIAILYDGKFVAYYRDTYLIIERVNNNKTVVNYDTHVVICALKASLDGQSVVIGGADGTILCYKLIDKETVNVEEILKTVISRQIDNKVDRGRPLTAKTRKQSESLSLPAMSRAGSALYASDRDILKKIRPVYRSLSPLKPLDTYRCLSASSSFNRSKTCNIM